MDVRRSEEAPNQLTIERGVRVNFDELLSADKRTEAKFNSYGKPLTDTELNYQASIESNTTSILLEISHWLETKTIEDAAVAQIVNTGEIDSTITGVAVAETSYRFYNQYAQSHLDFEKEIDKIKYKQRIQTISQHRERSQSLIDQYSIAKESHEEVARKLDSFLLAVVNSPKQYDSWIKSLTKKAESSINDALIKIASDKGIAEIQRRLDSSLEDTQPIAPLTKPEKLVGSEIARQMINHP